MQEIADKTGWNYFQVRYWMVRYGISRRSWSEAIYLKNNPEGNPFKIKKIISKKDIELFNLGIGLFLGEGTKKSKFNVVLANSDPNIINLFLKFLRKICRVKEVKIKAWLNVFDDINVKKATEFWSKKTGVPLSKFSKPAIRKSKGGSYKNKSVYGTISVFVSNIKLKELMDKWCKEAITCCL